MKILRAKHWQVFLVTYGFQLIVPFLVGISENLQQFLPKIELSLVYTLIVFLFWWFWSVAHLLQQFVDISLRISTRAFKVAFILPVIYLALFVGYFSKIGSMPLNDPWIIIPHIISIFCFLYLVGFTAKVIKVAETGRPASVNEYFGEIFLIFFFPIGIWFLQPRINKIVESDKLRTMSQN